MSGYRVNWLGFVFELMSACIHAAKHQKIRISGEFGADQENASSWVGSCRMGSISFRRNPVSRKPVFGTLVIYLYVYIFAVINKYEYKYQENICKYINK